MPMATVSAIHHRQHGSQFTEEISARLPSVAERLKGFTAVAVAHTAGKKQVIS